MTARTLDNLVAAGDLTAEEARVAMGGKKKRPKYGNVRCELDNFKFDSQRERDFYCELKIRERAGEIKSICVHPSFPITIEGIEVCKVELDFTFVDIKANRVVAVDVKGGRATMTPLSRLKHKLFSAVYQSEVEIVT